MGMTIDESITELEKARDSIEPCLFLDEAIDQSMKTAIEVMRKYQKIEQIIKDWEDGRFNDDVGCLRVKVVLEDDNSNLDNSSL